MSEKPAARIHTFKVLIQYSVIVFADQDILTDLEREKILVFTPSRRIGSRRIISYDDRYIIKLATDIDGVVVSNDNYRDLANENSKFKKVIEDRLLMYSFVNDR